MQPNFRARIPTPFWIVVLRGGDPQVRRVLVVHLEGFHHRLRPHRHTVLGRFGIPGRNRIPEPVLDRPAGEGQLEIPQRVRFAEDDLFRVFGVRVVPHSQPHFVGGILVGNTAIQSDGEAELPAVGDHRIQFGRFENFNGRSGCNHRSRLKRVERPTDQRGELSPLENEKEYGEHGD